MADTEITWGGLTLGGDTDYIVSEITGWEDLPDIADLSQSRSRGHGEHIGDLFSGSRVVTVVGKIADTERRDSLARALRAATTVNSALSELMIELLGEALSAEARVLRRAFTISPNYDVGEIPFVLQWRCPDPLRYGAPQVPQSTGLPTAGGGLTYPLTYPVSYGAAGNPGQITLFNEGTAPAPIVFDVTGSLPYGFQISAGSSRLTYPVAVPSGQVVEIDTAAGTAVVEGSADRRGNLTVADWMHVPAGTSLTVQFTSLGGAYDPTASLSARTRPAYW